MGVIWERRESDMRCGKHEAAHIWGEWGSGGKPPCGADGSYSGATSALSALRVEATLTLPTVVSAAPADFHEVGRGNNRH